MEKEVVFGIIVLLGVIVSSLYYGTLQSTMNRISVANRQMRGEYAWFNLIPVFNIFWPFIFNAALAKSIEKELAEKNTNHKVDFYSGTVVYPISSLLLLIFVFSGNLNDVSNFSIEKLYFPLLFLFSTLYFWVVFWKQINRAKRILDDRAYIPTQLSTYSILRVAILTGLVILGWYLYRTYDEGGNIGTEGRSTEGNIYENLNQNENSNTINENSPEEPEMNDQPVRVPNDEIYINPEDYFDGLWSEYALHFMYITEGVHGMFQVDINGNSADIMYRSLGEDIEYSNCKVVKNPSSTLIIGKDANGNTIKFTVFENKMFVNGFYDDKTEVCYEWVLGC